jgi:hypothetical protein
VPDGVGVDDSKRCEEQGDRQTDAAKELIFRLKPEATRGYGDTRRYCDWVASGFSRNAAGGARLPPEGGSHERLLEKQYRPRSRQRRRRNDRRRRVGHPQQRSEQGAPHCRAR